MRSRDGGSGQSSRQQGCGVGVVRNRRFLGEVGFLTTLGVGVGFFLSDSTATLDVQLDNFFHHTPKLGIPFETVQFLLKLLLKYISCCAPRFPLILKAKLHSLYVKNSESEIWKGRGWESESAIMERSDILPPTPQPYMSDLQCRFAWDWFLVVDRMFFETSEKN